MLWLFYTINCQLHACYYTWLYGGLDGLVTDFPATTKNLSLLQSSTPSSTGTGGISPALKQSWGQTYYLTPSKTKAKNMCLYLHSSMRLHDVLRNKHRTTQDALRRKTHRVYTGKEKYRTSKSLCSPETEPRPPHCLIILEAEVESTFKAWQPKYNLNKLRQWPIWCTLGLFCNTSTTILYMFRALHAHHQEVEMY